MFNKNGLKALLRDAFIIMLFKGIKMPKAYVLGQVNILDQNQYFENYGAKVSATVEQYGGKYLVRGGNITDVEGQLPSKRIVIMEFADKTAALTWYNSPEYQSIIDGRHKNAQSILNIIEGI
jgi:uncharacterized protein (DUF1330 family)